MSLTGYNAYNYPLGFKKEEFHHVVLSVSGTVHTLYLDGSAVAINQNAGNIFTSYTTITNTVIGAQTALTQAFRGNIGDVRVYNYNIPQTLISSLYRDRNLIAYYPFDTSVNSLTPNYATLTYDASFIGTVTITSSSNVGTSALLLNNTAGSTATQYISAAPGNGKWNLNASTGLTISCWIKTVGVTATIQRIFDMPLSSGLKGLSVDISGTNQIYSSWNYTPLYKTAQVFLPLTTDLTNYGTNGNINIDISNLVQNENTVTFNTYNGNSAVNNQTIIISGLYNTGLFRSEFTISCWFYIRSLSPYYNAFPFLIYNNIGTNNCKLNTENTSGTINPVQNIFTYPGSTFTYTGINNAWNLFSLTYKNKSLKIYNNNNLAGTVTSNIDISINNINLIDDTKTTDGGPNPIPCRLFSLFNRELTQSEITTLYNEQLNLTWNTFYDKFYEDFSKLSILSKHTDPNVDTTTTPTTIMYRYGLPRTNSLYSISSISSYIYPNSAFTCNNTWYISSTNYFAYASNCHKRSRDSTSFITPNVMQYLSTNRIFLFTYDVGSIQANPAMESAHIFTNINIITEGTYSVSFAISFTSNIYFQLKVGFGTASIIFNNTNTTYTTSGTGTISLSAYNISSTGTVSSPSILMQNNPSINALVGSLVFITLTFSNVSVGINKLSFGAPMLTTGGGFGISEIKVT